MDKATLKDRIKTKLNAAKPVTEESAVGAPGRTAHHEADQFVNENESLVNEFKRLVKQIGGKAVAQQLLGRMSMSKAAVTGVGLSEESVMKWEDAFKFEKNLYMDQKDFDEFIELGLVDVFPRKQGNEVRIDLYAKGKPVIRGYYYPALKNLHSYSDLSNMASRSMRI